MEMTQLEKRLVNRESHSQKNIEIAGRFFSAMELDGIGSVLEVGCGIGMVAAHLAERYGMKVNGTDYDPEQVALAKQKFPEHQNLQFQAADAANLPFGDNEFDMVLSFMVLHHIGKWEQALEEISRVLRPGGYYLFNDLAFSSGKLVKVLRSLFKNYGVYTTKEVSTILIDQELKILYRETPHGFIMKHHTIVFQKPGW
jgi:ubiquinone/menaquinone biosynthesis C-methylase UbiE